MGNFANHVFLLSEIPSVVVTQCEVPIPWRANYRLGVLILYNLDSLHL